MKKRVLRVNELIKREVGRLILERIDLSGALITVTRAESTENLRRTKIYISVIPENQKDRVHRILHKLAPSLQCEINRRLKIYPIPRIIFSEERETEKAEKVERILTEIEKKEVLPKS